MHGPVPELDDRLLEKEPAATLTAISDRPKRAEPLAWPAVTAP